jgi:hypothetical protein
VVQVQNGLADLVLITLAVVAAVETHLVMEAQEESEAGELAAMDLQITILLAEPILAVVAVVLVDIVMVKLAKMAGPV